MSCPSWQWHRTGSRWSPVRTLPVAPLWCDLGFFPNSRGDKAAANLRPTVGSLFEPYLWRPCGVTWDIVPEQSWSLVTVMLVRLYSWQLLPRAVTLPWLSEAGQ